MLSSLGSSIPAPPCPPTASNLTVRLPQCSSLSQFYSFGGSAFRNSVSAVTETETEFRSDSIRENIGAYPRRDAQAELAAVIAN